MVDNYKLQATYFANVLIHQTNAIACVHLEDSEDKPFWNTLLQNHRSGFYYYITYSRSKKGNDTSGCEQCLKYRPYLSKQFFTTVGTIRQQLRYTNKTVKEICNELDFPNLSFFGKFVKEHLGMSPTEYRQQNLNNECRLHPDQGREPLI